jgi:hypothetical protein
MNLNAGVALSAYEIWSAVCGKYEEATRANRTALRRHLQQLRYRDGDDMDKYLNSFRKAASELSSIGATMSDDDLTDMLLCSLPKSFDTLIQTTQESSNNATFTITCNRVTAEARRQKLRLSEEGSSAEASTAFYSRQDGNAAAEGKSNRGAQGDRPRCDHCGRLGHAADRCWMKHPELRPNRFKRKDNEQGTAGDSKRNKVGQNGDKSQITLYTAVSNATMSKLTLGEIAWIVDSAATAHFCHTRSYFTSLQSILNQTVTLGDNTTVSATGRGDIPVRLNLHGTSITATIADVLYVPDLGFNLLSIHKMTQSGLQVTFEDTSCIIRSKRPDRSIIASAPKIHDGLYRLDLAPLAVMMAAPTVTRADGMAATAATWHSRLGHLHLDGLVKLNTLVTDFEFKRADGQQLPHCETCIAGKLHRAAMPRAAERRATEPLE